MVEFKWHKSPDLVWSGLVFGTSTTVKGLVYLVTSKMVFCCNPIQERSSNAMCRESLRTELFASGNPEQCQVLLKCGFARDC